MNRLLGSSSLERVASLDKADPGPIREIMSDSTQKNGRSLWREEGAEVGGFQPRLDTASNSLEFFMRWKSCSEPAEQSAGEYSVQHK